MQVVLDINHLILAQEHHRLARLLGGQDHMTVQRLQQAGMRGVATAVQNNKALNRAARPLPTLNMPVASDGCDMSL